VDAADRSPVDDKLESGTTHSKKSKSTKKKKSTRPSSSVETTSESVTLRLPGTKRTKRSSLSSTKKSKKKTSDSLIGNEDESIFVFEEHGVSADSDRRSSPRDSDSGDTTAGRARWQPGGRAAAPSYTKREIASISVAAAQNPLNTRRRMSVGSNAPRDLEDRDEHSVGTLMIADEFSSEDLSEPSDPSDRSELTQGSHRDPRFAREMFLHAPSKVTVSAASLGELNETAEHSSRSRSPRISPSPHTPRSRLTRTILPASRRLFLQFRVTMPDVFPDCLHFILAFPTVAKIWNVKLQVARRCAELKPRFWKEFRPRAINIALLPTKLHRKAQFDLRDSFTLGSLPLAQGSTLLCSLDRDQRTADEFTSQLVEPSARLSYLSGPGSLLCVAGIPSSVTITIIGESSQSFTLCRCSTFPFRVEVDTLEYLNSTVGSENTATSVVAQPPNPFLRPVLQATFFYREAFGSWKSGLFKLFSKQLACYRVCMKQLLVFAVPFEGMRIVPTDPFDGKPVYRLITSEISLLLVLAEDAPGWLPALRAHASLLAQPNVDWFINVPTLQVLECGVVTRANSLAKEVLGVDSNRIFGAHISELVSGNDKQFFQSRMWLHAVRRRDPAIFQFTTADGTVLALLELHSMKRGSLNEQRKYMLHLRLLKHQKSPIPASKATNVLQVIDSLSGYDGKRATQIPTSLSEDSEGAWVARFTPPAEGLLSLSVYDSEGVRVFGTPHFVRVVPQNSHWVSLVEMGHITAATDTIFHVTDIPTGFQDPLFVYFPLSVISALLKERPVRIPLLRALNTFLFSQSNLQWLAQNANLSFIKSLFPVAAEVEEWKNLLNLSEFCLLALRYHPRQQEVAQISVHSIATLSTVLQPRLRTPFFELIRSLVRDRRFSDSLTSCTLAGQVFPIYRSVFAALKLTEANDAQNAAMAYEILSALCSNGLFPPEWAPFFRPDLIRAALSSTLVRHNAIHFFASVARMDIQHPYLETALPILVQFTFIEPLTISVARFRVSESNRSLRSDEQVVAHSLLIFTKLLSTFAFGDKAMLFAGFTGATLTRTLFRLPHFELILCQCLESVHTILQARAVQLLRWLVHFLPERRIQNHQLTRSVFSFMLHQLALNSHQGIIYSSTSSIAEPKSLPALARSRTVQSPRTLAAAGHSPATRSSPLSQQLDGRRTERAVLSTSLDALLPVTDGREDEEVAEHAYDTLATTGSAGSSLGSSAVAGRPMPSFRRRSNSIDGGGSAEGSLLAAADGCELEDQCPAPASLNDELLRQQRQVALTMAGPQISVSALSSALIVLNSSVPHPTHPLHARLPITLLHSLVALCKHTQRPIREEAIRFLAECTAHNHIRQHLISSFSTQELLKLVWAGFSLRVPMRIYRSCQYEHVVESSVIGRGANALVVQGTYQGVAIALKKFHILNPGDEDERAAVLLEVGIMTALNHPHVLRSRGALIPDALDDALVLMDWYQNGSLEQFVEGSTPCPCTVEQRLQIILDVANGMEYLHRCGIIHRDLKPGNILVCSKWRATLADFDVAAYVGPEHRQEHFPLLFGNAVGTGFYTSPENLAGLPYSFPTDVYSFGVTLWEFWYEQPAFSDVNGLYIFKAVVQEEKRPLLPESNVVTQLIDQCWTPNPGERPTFRDIVAELKAIREVAQMGNLNLTPHSKKLKSKKRKPDLSSTAATPAITIDEAAVVHTPIETLVRQPTVPLSASTEEVVRAYDSAHPRSNAWLKTANGPSVRTSLANPITKEQMKLLSEMFADEDATLTAAASL